MKPMRCLRRLSTPIMSLSRIKCSQMQVCLTISACLSLLEFLLLNFSPEWVKHCYQFLQHWMSQVRCCTQAPLVGKIKCVYGWIIRTSVSFSSVICPWGWGIINFYGQMYCTIDFSCKFIFTLLHFLFKLNNWTIKVKGFLVKNTHLILKRSIWSKHNLAG